MVVACATAAVPIARTERMARRFNILGVSKGKKNRTAGKSKARERTFAPLTVKKKQCCGVA
jgi:hypothetical protein